MRYMPSSTSTDYVPWHKQMVGSTFDFKTSTLASNSTIAAIALYGKSHWYWNVDESAFMSGTLSSVVSRTFNTKITHQYATQRVSEREFNFSTSVNCILQETIAPNLTVNNGSIKPLYSFMPENGYVEPEKAELPAAPETSSGASKEDDKSIYEAISYLPLIYKAIIIIPCVIVVLAAIFIATLFIVRSSRKKKQK